jgi:hypothetical protein
MLRLRLVIAFCSNYDRNVQLLYYNWPGEGLGLDSVAGHNSSFLAEEALWSKIMMST